MLTRKQAALAFRGFFVVAAALIILPDAFGEIRTRSSSVLKAASASWQAGMVDAPASMSLRVIDGDTLEDRTTGTRYRLANIDTPETGGRERCDAERRLGERATAEARRIVSRARQVYVEETGRIDRYGRTVAYVRIDGRDLGRALMGLGVARPWRGRREPWCL